MSVWEQPKWLWSSFRQRDPFGFLVGFGSKSSGGVFCRINHSKQQTFADFQNAAKSSAEFFRAKLSKKNTITEQLSGRGIVNIVVLEHNKKNVTILVQRALLYESMEKYKLGAEDL
ncbi:Uncharacterized protein Rs2_24709 [Raphanus sativus]|nr:Uncharacterized protein Rs2_24709 [Raphanus sativus]